ncbi:MAG: hypothetical protein ACJ73L_05070 [Actinomycetes bacterium]
MTTPSGSGDSEDRDEFGDPKAIDAAFDEIVANIDHPATEASTEPWPNAENDQRPEQPDAPHDTPTRTPRTNWTGWDDLRPAPVEPTDDDIEDADSDEDEGHYVPPPPPPVPKGDNVVRWAWAGAVGAPILAIVLPLLGQSVDGFIGLLLVGAFLGGFITLISRLRPGPSIDDDPDDGAIV